MPDPTPLDVSEFLVPIGDDSPSGESLRYEDDYAEIERAREEEEGAEDDPRWRKRNLKKADWELVITLGMKALKAKSKDLEIAGWVAEALSRRRGLAGVRDGLRLVRAIQDAFWETAHPQDELGKGDLELREGVYEFLDDDKRLPLLIRGTPVVSVMGLPAYSYLMFKESRDVKNLLMREPDRADALKAEGKILPEDFDQSVDATDRAFYVSTQALLGECIEATRELNQSLRADDHYGRKAPILSKTAAALEDVAKVVGQFLAKKPAPEPEPAEEAEETGSSWPSEDDQATDEALPTWESDSDPPPEPARPSPSRARTAPRPAGGPISGPEDARSRIAEAARHLRAADASDPAPYLVVRALRMGDRYRLANPMDPSKLPPPTTEDRQALRRLAGEGAWAELLEQSEIILGRPEGTGWLDARRLALKALGELGLEDAARASKALLRAELLDYPDWPRSELDDGTPCAGAETRAWVDETFPAGGAESNGSASYQDKSPSFEGRGPRADEGDSDRPLDPWDEAQDLHRLGRSQEAIALIGRAARDAKTGRERFFRTFQQAELCLLMGRPGVATPLLEGLARQIDEFRLDRWEDPALCARVVAALYRCVRGKDEARARVLYDRLCQLDIGQALGVGEGIDA